MVGQMQPAELKRRMDAGDPLVLLDVRETEELALAALPGVVHVPLRQIRTRVNELDPDAEVVVLCHHGVRSMAAAVFLVEQDFALVHNLVGGIDLWAARLGGVPRY
jgi:rhodanese-related sulfurtransferase